MKKIILLIIFILFLSSVGYAQPPFEQESREGSIQIDFPKNEIFKFNEPFELHWHIFNSTNHLIRNDTGRCFIDMYDLAGHHIVQQELNYDPPFDFEFLVNSSLLTKVGRYPYIIGCNDSASLEGGFISTSFLVTNSGLPYDEHNSWLVLIIILGIITLCFGAATFMIKSETLSSMKAFFFLLFIVHTLFLGVTLYILTLNPNNVEAFKPVGLTYMVVMGLVLVYFIWAYGLHLIRRTFQIWAKKKEEEEY